MRMLIALIFSALLLARAPASAQPTDVRLGLNLPHAISQDEFDVYACLLRLSPEQQFQSSAIWIEHLGKRDALMDSHRGPLDELSSRAAVLESTQGYTASAVTAFEEFWTRQNQLRAELQNEDRKFFEHLIVLLAPSQIERLSRAESYRARARCNAFERAIPGARIDLCPLVWAAGGQASLDAAEHLLLQYEAIATPVFRDLERAIIDDRVPLMRLASQITLLADGRPNDYQTAEGQQRAEDGLRKRAEMLSHTARLQRRIAAVNEQFLGLLKDVLSEELFRAIETRYLSAAYPVVFPDRQSCRNSLFEAFVGLDDETSNRLTTLRDEFARQYFAICKKQMDAFGDWKEHMAASQSLDGYADYAANMRNLRDERLRLHLRSFAELRNLVGPSNQSKIEHVKAMETDIKTILSLSDVDPYPGP